MKLFSSQNQSSMSVHSRRWKQTFSNSAELPAQLRRNWTLVSATRTLKLVPDVFNVHLWFPFRREWDMFLVAADHPDGSSVPQSWVLPDPPSDQTWASALQPADSDCDNLWLFLLCHSQPGRSCWCETSWRGQDWTERVLCFHLLNAQRWRTHSSLTVDSVLEFITNSV